MSHIVKDIKDIKTTRNTLFYDIINIKNLIKIILKWMKSYTQIF